MWYHSNSSKDLKGFFVHFVKKRAFSNAPFCRWTQQSPPQQTTTFPLSSPKNNWVYFPRRALNREHFEGDSLTLNWQQQQRVRRMGTVTAQAPQKEPHRASCGYSYSQFVRKCSECLTDRQLERVAMRLKIYKGLKKVPGPQNRLKVVRDIERIVPRTCSGFK